MAQDKASDPKGTSPDDFTKTTNKGNVELSEEELKKAAGGGSDYYLKVDNPSGESTANDVTFNFQKIV